MTTQGDVIDVGADHTLGVSDTSGVRRILQDRMSPSQIAGMSTDRAGSVLAIATAPTLDPLSPESLTAETRVQILDLHDGTVLFEDTIPDRMLGTDAAMAIADGGSALAVCDVTGGLTVWTIHPESSKRSIRISQGPAVVALSPDGTLLAVGAASAGTSNAWVLRSDTLMATEDRPVITHERGIVSIEMAPDGSAMASLDAAGKLRLTEFTGDAESWSAEAHQDQEARSVRFSADGSWVLTRGADGTLHRWRRRGDAQSQTRWGLPIEHARIDADGTALIESAGVQTRRRLPTGEIVSTGAVQASQDWARDSESGLTVAGGPDGHVSIHTDSGRMLWSRHVHDTRVRSAALSSDGRRLLTTALEGDVLLLDSETGAQLAALPWRTALVVAAGFINDDQQIAMLGMDGRVRILDASYWQAAPVNPRASRSGRPATQESHPPQPDESGTATP
jgi:WD40 repeat protein